MEPAPQVVSAMVTSTPACTDPLVFESSFFKASLETTSSGATLTKSRPMTPAKRPRMSSFSSLALVMAKRLKHRPTAPLSRGRTRADRRDDFRSGAPRVATVASQHRQHIEVPIASAHLERDAFRTVRFQQQLPVAQHPMHEIHWC